MPDALLNWDSNADGRFEECIACFEKSWEKHLKQGGPQPVWYDFLPADEPLRSRLAGELACIDLERRLTSGDTDCSVGDYFQQMPCLGHPRGLVDRLGQRCLPSARWHGGRWKLIDVTLLLGG